jgi:hypothetical protein
VTRDACGGCRTRRHPEDRAGATNVRVHARRGDPELGGDLLRRPATRDRAQDLALPIGQRVTGRLSSRESVAREDESSEQTDEKRSGALHLCR